MDRYSKFLEQLYKGTCMIINGATGTELERRGVPQLLNAWNGGGALSHPDLLVNLYKEYIASGAHLIISNTFATSKHALKDAGELENFANLNTRGVELAIAAREQLNKKDILVAGGISYWSWTGNFPSSLALGESICEQSFLMKEAGADLLILEMMVDVERMNITLESAETAGLPIWVGFSCRPDDLDLMCLLNGEPLYDAVCELKARDVDLVNIMHTDVDFIDPCLDVINEAWGKFVGVYPSSGYSTGTDWHFEDVISPDKFCLAADRWRKRGTNIIGGCCGIGTDHIRTLSDYWSTQKLP